MNVTINGAELRVKQIPELVQTKQSAAYSTLNDFTVDVFDSRQLYDSSNPIGTDIVLSGGYGSGRVTHISWTEETNITTVRAQTIPSINNVGTRSGDVVYPRVFGRCIRVPAVNHTKATKLPVLISPIHNKGKDHSSNAGGQNTGLCTKVSPIFSYGVEYDLFIGKMRCRAVFTSVDEQTDIVTIVRGNLPVYDAQLPCDTDSGDPDSEFTWVGWLTEYRNIVNYFVRFNSISNINPLGAYARVDTQEGQKFYLEVAPTRSVIYYPDDESPPNNTVDNLIDVSTAIAEVRAVPDHAWVPEGAIIPFIIEAGSSIRKREWPWATYVIADAPVTEVQEVVGKRNVGGQDITVPIPSRYWNWANVDAEVLNPELAGQTVSVINIPEDITTFEEGWGDEIWVTMLSSRPSTVEDIIAWHISEYTDLTFDANGISVSGRNFALFSEYDVLDLITTLAYEGLCGVSISGSTITLYDLLTKTTDADALTDENIIAIKWNATEFTEVKTFIDCTVTVDYSIEPKEFAVSLNTHKFGMQKDTYDFLTITNEAAAKLVANYWLTQYSEVWKTAEVVLPRQVRNVFERSTLYGITCRTNEVRHNFDDETTTIVVQTGVPVGTSATNEAFWSGNRGEFSSGTRSPVDYIVRITPGYGYDPGGC